MLPVLKYYCVTLLYGSWENYTPRIIQWQSGLYMNLYVSKKCIQTLIFQSIALELSYLCVKLVHY